MLYYVWIAYSNKAPYLPVAVADTSKELSAIMGVSQPTITSSWNRYHKGKLSRTRYHKVPVLLEEVS